MIYIDRIKREREGADLSISTCKSGLYYNPHLVHEWIIVNGVTLLFLITLVTILHTS